MSMAAKIERAVSGQLKSWQMHRSGVVMVVGGADGLGKPVLGVQMNAYPCRN